ncbi:MAG TPA: STAS domain-containing protein [Ignavibacteriaceae bacterium]|nr:STAS domain-containing protein [Ignavibacteriaceae bacterium]
MDFIKENYGDVIVQVVDLTRATMKEADEFKRVLLEDIEKGYKKLIVDLSVCEFIDSTFLGALVVSLKKITNLGGDLRLVGFQPGVHSMFELTRMNRVFDSYKSKEEAVKSFN